MGYFPPREAVTTLKCPICGQNLHIRRLCQKVSMECGHCQISWPLADYISKADKAMEDFLENVYFDRI